MKKHLKDYFIPHEGNDYSPHGLQKAAMTGLLAMVLLSFTLANIQSFLWIASDWMVSTVLPAVIVDMTNTERSGETLGQLRRNSTLDTAAQMKAQHMAEKEYFAHFSPEGVSPWFWFAQANYNFVHAGENLAIHFTDSGDVIQAWMDSPAHRANIMNGNYTEIGVGTAEGEFEGFKTVYVVQLFGTPAAQPVAIQERVAVAQAAEVAVVPPPIAQAETAVLSESVDITEDVVRVPAQPVAVAQREEIILVAEAPADDSVATSSTKPESSLFSDFISTSTGAAPASIDPMSPESAGSTPFFLEVLTQPHVVLQVLYITIGLLVLLSLLLSVFIEIRKQQPLQIVYSIGLLALMTGLFYVHQIIGAGAVIL